MTGSHWILLRPIDRLYFGPPRAQVAGEVHGGRSDFPPSPFTVAGMVRTRLLEGAMPGLDLGDWSPAERSRRARLVGTANELPPGWQLVGPFPAIETNERVGRLEPWLPLPAWIVCADGWRLEPYRFIARRGEESVHTEEGLSSTPIADDDLEFENEGSWVGAPHVKTVEHGPTWVPASVLGRILAGDKPLSIGDEPWVRPWKDRYLEGSGARMAGPSFVKWESAPGVAIDPESGTAMDSMLYALDMLRFAPRSGLLVSVTAALEPPLSEGSLEHGVGRAGRKGQAAAFEPATRVSSSWNSLLDGGHLGAPAEEDTFWLYLGTPAGLRDPYRDVISELRAAAPHGVAVSLLALVTGEPLVIGGLAMDGGQPRSNALYARAGSGWLVRLTGGRSEERQAVLQRFHGCSTLGPEKERAFGFGFTLVGRGPRIPLPDSSTDRRSAPKIGASQR